MPGDQFITGLDLGSYFIKASAITGKNGDIIFSAYGLTEGISNNKITDSNRFANSVRKVLRQLEIKIGSPVDKVFLSVDSDFVRAQMNRGSAGIGGGTVQNQDIYRALLNSMLVAKEKDEEIIDLLVSEYKIDGVKYNNPKGVKGNLLDVTSQVVIADKEHLIEVNKALNTENVFLSGTGLSVHGMANMLLSKKQRNDGVLLIDSGHTKTELVVYKGNKVVYQDTVPLGGKNITKDLSIVLKISMDDAEDLKVQFGKGNLDKSFPKYNLIEEVIQARSTEILGYVRLLFTKYKDHKDINEAYVYGGGLCGFKNISNYCKDNLKISTNFITSDIIKSDDVFTLNATGCAYNIIHEIQSDLIVKRFYEQFAIKAPIIEEKNDDIISKTTYTSNTISKDYSRNITPAKIEKEEEDYFSIFDKVKKNSLNKVNKSNKANEEKKSNFDFNLSAKKDSREEARKSYSEYKRKIDEVENEYDEESYELDNKENKFTNKIKKLFGIE